MDNLALYAKQAMSKKQRVWFVGDCALKKGVGVCFELGFTDTNEDDQAATDDFGFRSRAVMLPRTASILQFAGVTAHAYDAAPTPAGQPIDIYLPGSAAMVQTAVDTVCGTTEVQCQTQEHGITGTKTSAVISGKTVTQTGGDLINDGVLAGDVFYISAGTGPKTGGYTIASVTSAEVLVLENAPGDYAAASADLVYVVIKRAHASGTFYDASASGVFVASSGYGKSCAYAMQTSDYVSTSNSVLCKLSEGDDNVGVT